MLHKYFEKVTGIDISSDMLKEAKNESVKLGISNIEWLNMPAESISEEVGVFKLITCGEALHWMDRETVINKCYKVITPGGGFVVLGAGGSIAKGKEKWQEVLRETIEKWIKTSENKPKWKSKEYKPHEEIIRESKFEKVEQRIFKYKKTYKIEEILGFLYTTSYCNKNLLGEKLAAFEKDLIDRLIDINSIGIFEEEREAYYIIGRKF